MGLSSKLVAADGGWPQAGLDIPSPDGQERQQQLRCPRCDSHSTKFCYYNNYSRMQPRHFCKACRRYWTQGGTLRNVPVPVGRGRNNKRQKKKKTKQQENISSEAEAEADPFRGLINSEQFSRDLDLERSMFPSFNWTMMYSAAGGDEAMSLLSPAPLMLLPETMTETHSGSGIFSPPPVSVASSSSNSGHHSHQIGQADDLLLTLMPGSTTEWLQDPPSLLSNYYSPAWWDDAGELAAFGQPAAPDDHKEL